MASKIEVEVELKSDAEKIWNSIRESTTVFPKALPQHYQSIQVLQGDGKSVNSVRLVHFPPAGAGIAAVASVKEKIEAVDEENKTVRYGVIEGDILQYYKNFKGNLGVRKGESGSTIKWWCEFDKASEQVAEPDFIKDFAIKTFHDLDLYILANN